MSRSQIHIESDLTAKIVEWDDQRGYGFLQSDNSRLFLHRRDFAELHKRPEVGDVIRFTVGSDAKGRPCAQNAVHVNDGGRITLIALAVLLSLLLLPLTAAYRLGLDMRWVSGLLLGMSFWSYWLYAKDKRLARVQERRVPESVLHVTELLGGWPGAFLAQRRLRHKVAKPGYQLVFWVIVLSYQFASADSFQQWKYFKAAWDAIDRATEHRK